MIEDDDQNVEIDEDVLVEDIQEEESVVDSDTSEELDSEIIPEDEEEEDRIITIGDEAPEEEVEEEQPVLVKKLRKVTRGLEKKNKALQKQIDAIEQAAQVEKPVELGTKPTLALCKYDDAKYEKELSEYWDRKKAVEKQAADKAKIAEDQNKKWQTRQESYVARKKEHSFKDYGEAEELVSTTFSQTQQGIIIQGAEDAALLVYALGKNPKKLEELAKITDPVEFTFKVSKLESQLNVTSRKAPSPEKRVSASKSGGISGNADKTLERLRAAADVSGDYTAVTAYKRKLRNKG